MLPPTPVRDFAELRADDFVLVRMAFVVGRTPVVTHYAYPVLEVNNGRLRVGVFWYDGRTGGCVEAPAHRLLLPTPENVEAAEEFQRRQSQVRTVPRAA